MALSALFLSTLHPDQRVKATLLTLASTIRGQIMQSHFCLASATCIACKGQTASHELHFRCRQQLCNLLPLQLAVRKMLPLVHKNNCVGMLERCSMFLMQEDHQFTTDKSKDNYVIRCVHSGRGTSGQSNVLLERRVTLVKKHTTCAK